MKISSRLIIMSLLVLITGRTYASDYDSSDRTIQNRSSRTGFNSGWAFSRYGEQADGSRLTEPDGIEAKDFDISGWQELDLPHDFAIAGPFRMDIAGNTGRLPYKGIGWYRKTFTVPAASEGKRILLDFDGVMAYSKVWINGQYAGGWPYGYTSFQLDITPYVKFGEDNVIAVRTDTEKWDSRWYPGAGIYRNVWISESPQVRVDYNGVAIHTSPGAGDNASQDISVSTTLRNHLGERKNMSVSVDLYEVDSLDNIGNKVSRLGTRKITVNPDDTATVTVTGKVKNMNRWSPESPVRYVARITVTDDGGIKDIYSETFGVREIAVDRSGLYINGERFDIKGVCNHHDLGSLGAAFNSSALKRQLDMLKDMGCNAIRTSHNPPAPELLDMADKMGFIVMVEAFDAWKTGKRENDYNRMFDDWHEADLTAMVKRDRNHPSVAMWSIGNEVLEQRDSVLTAHLARIIRSIDTTRPVTAGYNDPDGGRESGAAKSLDIMGVNYFFGSQPKWDADTYFSTMPTLGTETSSCVSTRGFYLPDGGEYQDYQITSYDVAHPGWGCTPDVQFAVNRQFPYLMGEFVWTGFDYLGEPTPFNSDDTNLLNFRNDPAKKAELEAELARLRQSQPPSRSSYFGIIDLAGFPKDRFYLYQSQWRPELPMAHILPHWTWPGMEGRNIPVQVYTSGDEAELFVNGKSMGRKSKLDGETYRLRWDSVAYTPGTIEVVAYRNGQEWARDRVVTAGAPYALRMSSPQNEIAGTDMAFITVEVIDKDGNVVPQANSVVTFSVEGAGSLKSTDNGDPTSFEPFLSPVKSAFNGLCLGIIEKSRNVAPGECKVTVSSPGLRSDTLNITVK